jgi:hypothetical protein
MAAPERQSLSALRGGKAASATNSELNLELTHRQTEVYRTDSTKSREPNSQADR